MPTVEYPTNPNTDTVFVTDDGGKRTRSLKTVVVDGTIDYPKNANVKDCYVTIDGKKQRALMTADISKEGSLEYPDGSNSTKGYVTVSGKKHRVVLTATLAGGAKVEELNVTPTTSAQTITAPEGTDGYSPVNVSAVTSSIDANIVAGNIKKDVEILGVTGDYTAPTPTGTINITTNGTHDVASYANADVQVPTTAPNFYLEKNLTQQGYLKPSSYVPNLNNIVYIEACQLAYAFYNNGYSGAISFSNLTTCDGGALKYAFGQAQNITSVTFGAITSVGADSVFEQMLYQSSATSLSFPLLATVTSSGVNAFKDMAGGAPLTTVSFPSLTTVEGGYAFNGSFAGCQYLTSIDFSNLQTVSGNYAFQNAFEYTKMTSVDFGKLQTVSGQYAFQTAFQSCTNLASIDMSKLQTISGQYAFYNSFKDCTSLTTVNLDSLETVMADRALAEAFHGCTALTYIGFPKLQQVSGSSALSALNWNNNIQTVSFPALTTCSGECFSYMMHSTGKTVLIEFPALESLNGNTQTYGHPFYKMGVPANITTTIKFQSLKSLASGVSGTTRYMFYSMATTTTNPTVIYFYALDTSLFGSVATSTKYFNNMLKSEINATVHFPIRTQSVLSTWTDVITGFGGTNTTVLFDIVTTLTGADSNSYERQEKDSTSTATAWVLNNTLYYTSGNTEPVVGDTIYSDAACTISVTTVSAIA